MKTEYHWLGNTVTEKFHWHVLEDMIKEHGWTRGAELGVRWGQTSLYLLENCPRLTMIGVDLMKRQPQNLGPGKETYQQWPWDVYESAVCKIEDDFGKRFKMYRMRMSQAAQLVADESLDFVFIDGDHSTDGVSCDIRCWAPKVKPDGMITGHDINLDSVKAAVDWFFVDKWETEGERWNWIWWGKKADMIEAGPCDAC